MVLIGALALAGAAFWAGRLTLTPPPAVVEGTDDQVVVVVAERTIGQTLDYGMQTSRASRPIATNALSGVVTAVPERTEGERRVGDVLYEVDSLPVRVVQGAAPFHRDLTVGLKGKDVAQLEGALVTLGYLDVANETFDRATSQAVSAWQRKLGMPVTGTVRLGELVAAPTLPAVVVVDEKVVWRGANLTGGEVVVSMGTGEPSFVLPLSPGQLNLVPADAPMTVEGFGKSWPAAWASERPNDESGAGKLISLSGPDGGPVCGKDCGLVPAKQAWVTVHIEVVPRVTGPAVPTSAVSTDATGQAWVVVVNGNRTEKRPVTVTRAHAGLAVVDGVEVGESVRALAAADDGPKPSLPPEPSDDETS